MTGIASRDGSRGGGAGVDVQAAANYEHWAVQDHVRDYATRELRPVEADVLDRYREGLSGRVLELGCGAGRVTGHLAPNAAHVHAIDVSASMIAYCRRTYPECTFRLGDMRDLSEHGDESFDAIVATFNVIDVLDHRERGLALDEWRRVLTPGALLVMSSHNRGHVASAPGPGGQVLESLRARNPRRLAGSLARLPRRVRNRRRLGRFEQREAEYEVVTDSGGDYSLLHYYISRDDQARQLTAHGYELLDCLDLDGKQVGPGESAADCPELHYIARRAV